MVDLEQTLVIAVSATALFDLREANSLFQSAYAEDPNRAIALYRQYMTEKETAPLDPGTGYPLVSALLQLNQFRSPSAPPLVEVVIMSRNSPDTGIRVLNAIRQQKLGITRSAFTSGASVVPYLEAFAVDLFLTTNAEDAQQVIDSQVCATAILTPPPPNHQQPATDQVRIAFDGDAVLFDDSSEIVYQTQGISQFCIQEDQQQNIPLPEGPYAHFLKKLSALQQQLPQTPENSPIRIALVTARNSPAEMRVLKTLRHWGVYVDEVFFMGGVNKSKVIKAFQPHIFFDDQSVHLQTAAQFVPAGKVPHRSDSPLHSMM